MYAGIEVIELNREATGSFFCCFLHAPALGTLQEKKAF
jgi:hypothetical protein